MVMRTTLTSLALSTLFILLAASPSPAAGAPSPQSETSRRMVLTFDDLPAQRAQSQPQARIVEITDGLLAALRQQRPARGGQMRQIPAIGFVNEDKLESDGRVDPARVKLLERWLDAGLELGNHSYSHPDLHRPPEGGQTKQGELADFQRDVLKGETVTRPLVTSKGGKLRYFRHPFLHTGRDLETKHGLERFLTEHGYRVAPVTIDNSEWIFARAYTEALDRGDDALRKKTADAYVDYMERMVEYYEGQSRALFEREIPQVLLLHANALNGHHLDRLIAMLERRGYHFIDLETALQDPAYDSPDTYVGRGGITWIHRWAITRGVDRSMFRGEPTTPTWVEELAGIRESPRGPPPTK